MLNVELLTKVKEHILEEPNRLLMSDWIVRREPGTPMTDDGQHQKFTMPACRTAGCIAGWCCLLTEGMDAGDTFAYLGSVRQRAINYLRLQTIPHELFYTEDWKPGFRAEWQMAETPEQRAQIVAEVIDEFIEDELAKEKSQ